MWARLAVDPALLSGLPRALSVHHKQDTGRECKNRQDLAAAAEADPWNQVQETCRDQPAAEQGDAQPRPALKQPHNEPPVSLWKANRVGILDRSSIASIHDGASTGAQLYGNSILGSSACGHSRTASGRNAAEMEWEAARLNEQLQIAVGIICRGEAGSEEVGAVRLHWTG